MKGEKINSYGDRTFCFVLDFLGKAKKMLQSDNPLEILEKVHVKASNNYKRELVEWDPQEFGMFV